MEPVGLEPTTSGCRYHVVPPAFVVLLLTRKSYPRKAASDMRRLPLAMIG